MRRVAASAFAFRLLHAIATLFVISFLVYILIGLMPGDPVDLMIAGNPRMTPADALHLRALYGLDQPLPTRYLHWLQGALHGHLGYSRLYHLPVLDVIWPRLIKTAKLLGAALLLTVAAAVPLGVLAAARAGRKTDKAINVFCLAGVSMPSFWAGLLLISLFSVTLGWLPASAVENASGTGMAAKSLIMPVVTLSVGSLAVYARHLRTAMIDVLNADYIRTAAAKGCGPARILWRHALRGAALPVITVFMLDVGTLAGGAVTIETVFAYPGMGKLLFDAVMGNDYNLALCGFLILSACVIAANMLADALYALLDPRITSAKGAS